MRSVPIHASVPFHVIVAFRTVFFQFSPNGIGLAFALFTNRTKQLRVNPNLRLFVCRIRSSDRRCNVSRDCIIGNGQQNAVSDICLCTDAEITQQHSEQLLFILCGNFYAAWERCMMQNETELEGHFGQDLDDMYRIRILHQVFVQRVMRRDVVRTENAAVFAAFGKHGIKEDIAAFENILIKLFYVFVTNAFVFEYFTKEINDSGAAVRK